MPSRDIEMVVDDAVLRRFPSLCVFALAVRGLKGSTQHPALSPGEYDPTPTGISEIAQIADWRLSYQQMGLRASKYFSSVEALVRRAAKGRSSWMTPFPLVNFYNSVSLTHLATIGAYDLSTLPRSEIRVRQLASGSDRFRPLGKDTNFPMEDGIVVYAAENDILCWAMNHRDSSDFCLSEETDDALCVSEAISPTQFLASMNAILEIKDRCTMAGSHSGSLWLFDAQTPRGRSL